MSVFSDLVAAPASLAGAIGQSRFPARHFNGIDIKGVDLVKLASLHSIFTGENVASSAGHLLTRQTGTSSWPFRLPLDVPVIGSHARSHCERLRRHSSQLTGQGRKLWVHCVLSTTSRRRPSTPQTRLALKELACAGRAGDLEPHRPAAGLRDHVKRQERAAAALRVYDGCERHEEIVGCREPPASPFREELGRFRPGDHARQQRIAAQDKLRWIECASDRTICHAGEAAPPSRTAISSRPSDSRSIGTERQLK